MNNLWSDALGLELEPNWVTLSFDEKLLHFAKEMYADVDLTAADISLIKGYLAGTESSFTGHLGRNFKLKLLKYEQLPEEMTVESVLGKRKVIDLTSCSSAVIDLTIPTISDIIDLTDTPPLVTGDALVNVMKTDFGVAVSSETPPHDENEDEDDDDDDQWDTVCEFCGNPGQWGEDRCPKCSGQGYVSETDFSQEDLDEDDDEDSVVDRAGNVYCKVCNESPNFDVQHVCDNCRAAFKKM